MNFSKLPKSEYASGFRPVDLSTFSGVEVTVRNGRTDDAIRYFKSLVQKEDVLGLYKERQAYEKPSVKLKRKRKESKERRLAQDSKEKMILSGEWDKRQKQKQDKKMKRQKNSSDSPNERSDEDLYLNR